MNRDQNNIESTINYYDQSAQELIPIYDKAEMSTFYHILLENLTPKAKVLDIGFGSGRDLAFLKNHGFDIWGIDPSQKFIDHAEERFNNISDHFFKASLPDLDIPKELLHSFDNVILIAVWMHLPKEVYLDAITALCSLLKPQGKVILSYSITPRTGETQRYFENVDTELLQSLLKEQGCTKTNSITNGDGLDEREIRWVTEAYLYDKL